MPYNSLIPQPGDLLSQSQADLLANFTAINTLVSVNHEDFNNVAPHAQGKHKQLEMPNQAATVATDPTQWSMNVVNNTLGVSVPAIWLTPPVTAQHPAGTAYDITTAGLNNSGWCRLPCGLILKWGQVNLTNAGAQPVTFPVAVGIPVFSTILNVQITTVYTDGDTIAWVVSYAGTIGFIAQSKDIRSGGHNKGATITYLAMGV